MGLEIHPADPLEKYEHCTFNELVECQFNQWYPKLNRYSIDSVCLQCSQPDSDELFKYLTSDGLFVPAGFDEHVEYANEQKALDSSEDESNGDEPQNYKISESLAAKLHTLWDQAVAKFGRDAQIFPKLNWSAPQDASWILANSKGLCCSSMQDVFLALKSSDLIGWDLHGYLAEIPKSEKLALQLVFRRYVEINPSYEFRCFVRDGAFVALCQRNIGAFFPHLKLQAEDFKRKALEFCSTVLLPCLNIKSFVFDIGFTEHQNGRLILVDINPFCMTTDPLLFSWSELSRLDQDSLVCRTLESQIEADKWLKGGSKYSSSQVPYEVVNYSERLSTSNENDEMSVQLLELLKQMHSS